MQLSLISHCILPQNNEKDALMKLHSRLSNILIALAILWGMFILFLGNVTEPSPENLTVLLSTLICGAYTLGLRVTRRFWLPRLSRRPLRNAVYLGVVNAAFVETVFVLIEKMTSAQGVAAHPNLLLDLLLTMPWYTAMTWTFVGVQHRRRFDPAVVLLLGAVYELGADGILGPLLALLSGDFQILTPTYWLLMALSAFWVFIPVYSPLVLPPAWVIASAPQPERPSIPAWREALKPLLWLIPFGLYILVLMLILDLLPLA